MRLLIVSSGIPTRKYPLLGVFEFDQAKALAAAGHDVMFFAVDLRSIRRWRRWGIHQGIKDGVPYWVVNFPIGRAPLKYMLKVGAWLLYRMYKKCYKRQSSPSLVHAHFTEMGYLAAILNKKTGIPYIVTEHSSKMNQYNVSPDLKDCAMTAYSNALTVISVGSALSRRIFKHTGIRPVIVPNIIDTELFLKCHNKNHEGFQIVTTSNLIFLKRTWQIIQALDLIDPSEIDFHLTIIGDGPERENIEYWTKTLGLEGRVTLLGYQSRQAIAQVYEMCDCFMLVSSTETFGVAYVEAMAAGLPVIATRCGGPEDFVNDDNGILVDVDNINQIAGAIRQLHEKAALYKSERLRNFVVNHYSPNVIACELTHLYECFNL